MSKKFEREKVAPIAISGFDKDPELVEQGVPVSIGKNPDGSPIIVVVRPLNSDHYENRLDALRSQYSRFTLQNDKELDKQLQKEAVAEKVFIGFEGLYPAGAFLRDPQGAWHLKADAKPLTNDYDTRRALLEDRDFFLRVQEASGTMETFRREQVEADLGNSRTSSSGT